MLIAFEGVEGSGKTTQLRILHGELAGRGYEVVATREPGGTPIGERVRAVLLDPASAGMDDRAEALLFAACRAQLTAEVIRPALARGAVVLCDRYLHSSVAFQGYGRGLGPGWVAELNRWATGGLLPDLVILLQVDPATGLARLRRDRDRIEEQELSFHRTVARGYLDLARAEPERFAVIDAAPGVEEVAEQVRAAVLKRL